MLFTHAALAVVIPQLMSGQVNHIVHCHKIQGGKSNNNKNQKTDL